MQFVPTHRHEDGGLYQFVSECPGKLHHDNSEWGDGIIYRGEDGAVRWTSAKRWATRFTPMEAGLSHDVMLWDDENQNVAAFRVELHQAGDVFYMITRAGPQNNHRMSPEFLSWMKRVLQAQAEMIRQNLHIRDHDFPDLMGDVNTFHAKFGQEYTGKPRMLPEDLHTFRTKFHDEETGEYCDEYENLKDAINRSDRRDIITAMEKQLDALVDAVWVVLGTADLQFGRKAFIEAWRRVVKANMAKVLATDDPNAEDSGREVKYDIRKPAGWLPPDHRDLVEDNAVFDELYGTPAESNTFNQDADRYSDTRAI